MLQIIANRLGLQTQQKQKNRITGRRLEPHRRLGRRRENRSQNATRLQVVDVPRWLLLVHTCGCSAFVGLCAAFGNGGTYDFAPGAATEFDQIWLFKVPTNMQIASRTLDNTTAFKHTLAQPAHKLTTIEREQLKDLIGYVHGHGDVLDQEKTEMATRKLNGQMIIETIGYAYHHLQYVCSRASSTGKGYHRYFLYPTRAIYIRIPSKPNSVVEIRYSGQEDYLKYLPVVERSIESIQYAERASNK